MVRIEYPVIDTVATGDNIRRLREKRGLTVKDLQSYFGFEMPQAIYKWQRGESLPSVDNLYALGRILNVPMDQILIQTRPLHISAERQKDCRSDIFLRWMDISEELRPYPVEIGYAVHVVSGLSGKRPAYAAQHKVFVRSGIACDELSLGVPNCHAAARGSFFL